MVWADKQVVKPWDTEIAHVWCGCNPDQMHAERVDGYNPWAVIDAYSANAS